MNLLEVLDKAKVAKPKGREFEYHGVTFEFRSLQFDELSHLMDGMKAASEKDYGAIASMMNKVLELDLIIGWKNLTVETFARIAQLQLDFLEDRMAEEIQFDSREKGAEAIRVMAKNTDFAVFVSNSVMAITNERNAEIEQKKTT